MPRKSTDCPRCRQARRLASFCFAVFALALVLSASAPGVDPARQGALLLCGLLAGLALFRHPLARMGQAMRRKPLQKEP